MEVRTMLEQLIKTIQRGLVTSTLTLGMYGCSITKEHIKTAYPLLKHAQDLNSEMACYEQGNRTCETYPLMTLEFK